MSQYKMLAIDLGASSGRGIIGRFDGKKLTLEENHRFKNEPEIIAGTFTWDIMRIFHEIKMSINKCALSDDRDIGSIAIDTWGVDYGLLDKGGRLLSNPTHYRDGRTDDIQPYAFKTVPKDEIYGITGLQFMNFNTLFQLISEMRDSPERFAAADRMLFIPDLLNYFLTGIMSTEYTIASTGAILNARTRDYAWDLIDRFGIPRGIFTPIAQPATEVGPLSSQILGEVGDIKAKVVHAAAHDTASAVMAVPAKGNSFVYISSGTWSLMGTELRQPIISADSFRYDFTNEGGIYNTIRFLKNIMGMWLKEESKRQWAREGKEFTHDELSNAAVASKPLQSIINPDDILFSPPGDMPGRIRDYCRRTGQHVPENEGEVVRCIFDSISLRYRWTVERIDELMGHKAAFINIVGGGTKETDLCQFCADACARPVYTGPTEATAVGNMASQLIAAGELKDLGEARQMVRDSFEIKEYQPKNTEIWDEGYERFLGLLDK